MSYFKIYFKHPKISSGFKDAIINVLLLCILFHNHNITFTNFDLTLNHDTK